MTYCFFFFLAGSRCVSRDPSRRFTDAGNTFAHCCCCFPGGQGGGGQLCKSPVTCPKGRGRGGFGQAAIKHFSNSWPVTFPLRLLQLEHKLLQAGRGGWFGNRCKYRDKTRGYDQPVYNPVARGIRKQSKNKKEKKRGEVRKVESE